MTADFQRRNNSNMLKRIADRINQDQKRNASAFANEVLRNILSKCHECAEAGGYAITIIHSGEVFPMRDPKLGAPLFVWGMITEVGKIVLDDLKKLGFEIKEVNNLKIVIMWGEGNV